MFSKEDRIFIKDLRVEKGYGAKKIIAEFLRKNWSIASVNRLLRSVAFFKSECTAAGSVTFII